ncbi:MAG: L-threonylcarbamoyladenylate synthase [Myxococcota bacterium]|nr:L-threonylcarbamoyladenylate synthase [Myxococcota bacterium]MEC9389858.1 L-threonylcarbamoyladenylate synthase [Myxococcota bacterium]
MSEHIYTHDDPPNQRHLDRICSVLNGNGVVAMPAGCSWMFCCDAGSKKGVQRMMALKPGRNEKKPLSLVCSSISMATEMARVDGLAFKVLNRIVPGHFTVLLPSSRTLPKILKNKREVVGLRVPDEAIVMAVVEQFGRPLVATSIPTAPNGQNLTMGYEIMDTFGHGLDLVIDLGNEIEGQATTILDLTQGEVDVIREGAGDLSRL